MPRKNLKPEWEKEENRKIVFITLLNEPSSFTELLNKLSMSRGALSTHLKELEKEKVIERTRRNGKRVYQIIFDDEERLRNELKSVNYDLLIHIVSKYINPELAEAFNSLLDSLTNVIIYFKKRELMNEPDLSFKELHVKLYEIMKKSASPRIQKLMHIDEILKGLKETPESELSDREIEFENVKKIIKTDLKERKKNENKK
jgi:DNA-binding MarR family transcriptional regulator